MAETMHADTAAPLETTMSASRRGANPLLFALAILCGSFLLFLVQPLIARLALPLLGGAPAVWNSAMLVYQMLLLGGYLYAHLLSRLPLRRQIVIHIALLALAAVFLPVGLADLERAGAGWEVLWVPALVLASVGPLFVLISAQAPLLQGWYAADPDAGDPYWLYAASNIGSFAGLLAFPLLLEPTLTTTGQSLAWSTGYGVLVAIMVLVGFWRWNTVGDQAANRPLANEEANAAIAPASAAPGWRTIAHWLALSAVPSGLLLSTTTHLSTDLVAMPLLWVIPLGIYLFSFVLAFNPVSRAAAFFARIAPIVVLFLGAKAMMSSGQADLADAIGSIVMLLVVATALHRHLFELRPDPDRLTLFYLVMSAGGALGGMFAALVAPVLFDWVWEHPLLILAAAALLPPRALVAWMDRKGWDEARQRRMRLLLVAAAAALGVWLQWSVLRYLPWVTLGLTATITVLGVLALGKRWSLVAVLAILMFFRGGFENIGTSVQNLRERSYFGVYTIGDIPEASLRTLKHGTTMHGRQFTDAGRRLQPTAYYGPTSGAGLALSNAGAFYGDDASIGVVGMGAGTLLCYRKPGQTWKMYEIDPVVVEYSRNGTFTFHEECAPQSEIVVGDARLELAREPEGAFDVLVVDAFSSDAIPMHLMTREAMQTYADTLSPDGLLVIHISNRFIDLRPVLSAHARDFGWSAMLRFDQANGADAIENSVWVVLSPDAAVAEKLRNANPDAEWQDMPDPATRSWTDDYASILPYLMWSSFTGDWP